MPLCHASLALLLPSKTSQNTSDSLTLPPPYALFGSAQLSATAEIRRERLSRCQQHLHLSSSFIAARAPMAELTEPRKRKSGEAAPAQKRERKGAARPNILVTGTPGVGKTRAAEAIAARLGLQRLGVSELAKQLSAFEEFDEARQCQVLDEDRVLDAMEPDLGGAGSSWTTTRASSSPSAGSIWCSCCASAPRRFYDRLTARGYPEPKLQENLQCEIMQVVLEEAREAYAAEVVVELRNESEADLESMLARVAAWRDAWK